MGAAPLAQINQLSGSTGFQKRFTVAAATAISKGILMQLNSDPRTVATAGDPLAVPAGQGVFMGITAIEKDANDSSTDISLFTDGIFDIRASGAINLGGKVVCAGNNEVRAAQTVHIACSYALIVGTCLETAADAEVVLIDIGNR